MLVLRRWASALRSALGSPESEKTDGPAIDLTDDLIAEILSRLPSKSVCRFKCVSRHWLHGLITHPDFRPKIPQTLTGFFRSIVNYNDGREADAADEADADDEDTDDDAGYESADGASATSVPDFLSILGEKEHQSLSFLPGDLYRSISLKHCSHGLVVCLCWKISPTNESDYVVCNPATQQWVTLPGHGHRDRYNIQLHLAADLASASGHFHLFAILNSDPGGYIAGVDIYSSETGAWSLKETCWAPDLVQYSLPHSVFMDDMLHLVTMNRLIVAMDTKGSTWKTIPLLEDMHSRYPHLSNLTFMGKSQGRLHYVNNSGAKYYDLTVWTHEDDKWIRKHTITTRAIFGPKSPDMYNITVVAIHPEYNIIFFTVGDDKKLMSYDMDRRETRLRALLNSPTDGWGITPYLPYVPSWRSIPST